MERSRKADLIAAVLDRLDRMSAEQLRALLEETQRIKENKSNR